MLKRFDEIDDRLGESREILLYITVQKNTQVIVLLAVQLDKLVEITLSNYY